MPFTFKDAGPKIILGFRISITFRNDSGYLNNGAEFLQENFEKMTLK